MLDAIDRRILRVLQEDAALPMADLGERVGLTAGPCWRRVKRLEEAGYIRARVALLDRGKLGLPMTVFMTIRTARHSADWVLGFREAVRDIPEIIEAWRLAGQDDYVLKIVVPDIAAYDAVYQTLIARVEFSDISSSIVMEELKNTTALPVAAARR